MTSDNLFEPGRVLATPGVIEAAGEDRRLLLDMLRRHLSGDWGDVPPEDAELNDLSVKEGSRILSSYQTTDGETVWVITEADRNATTFLLPSEY